MKKCMYFTVYWGSLVVNKSWLLHKTTLIKSQYMKNKYSAVSTNMPSNSVINVTNYKNQFARLQRSLQTSNIIFIAISWPLIYTYYQFEQGKYSANFVLYKFRRRIPKWQVYGSHDLIIQLFKWNWTYFTFQENKTLLSWV